MQNLNPRLRMYLSDYSAACDDIDELIDAIIALVEKDCIGMALLNELVRRARDSGEYWAEIQRLGFKGTRQDAAYAIIKAQFIAEENLKAFKGGGND